MNRAGECVTLCFAGSNSPYVTTTVAPDCPYAWFSEIMDSISVRVWRVRQELMPTVSLVDGFIDVVDQVFVG